MTSYHSLAAVTCMLSHFSRISIFTTSKGTRNFTQFFLKTNMVLKIFQFTDPLTSFLVIKAVYLEIFDFSLVISVRYSTLECIWLATFRALRFIDTDKTVTTPPTKMVSTFDGKIRFCKGLSANKT